jgi:hypothetical protein
MSKRQWSNNIPIGEWGAMCINRKIYIGWRMTANTWFRPFITRHRPWNRFVDSGITIRINNYPNAKWKKVHTLAKPIITGATNSIYQNS